MNTDLLIMSPRQGIVTRTRMSRQGTSSSSSSSGSGTTRSTRTTRSSRSRGNKDMVGGDGNDGSHDDVRQQQIQIQQQVATAIHPTDDNGIKSGTTASSCTTTAMNHTPTATANPTTHIAPPSNCNPNLTTTTTTTLTPRSSAEHKQFTKQLELLESRFTEPPAHIMAKVKAQAQAQTQTQAQNLKNNRPLHEVNMNMTMDESESLTSSSRPMNFVTVADGDGPGNDSGNGNGNHGGASPLVGVDQHSSFSFGSKNSGSRSGSGSGSESSSSSRAALTSPSTQILDRAADLHIKNVRRSLAIAKRGSSACGDIHMTMDSSSRQSASVSFSRDAHAHTNTSQQNSHSHSMGPGTPSARSTHSMSSGQTLITAHVTSSKNQGQGGSSSNPSSSFQIQRSSSIGGGQIIVAETPPSTQQTSSSQLSSSSSSLRRSHSTGSRSGGSNGRNSTSTSISRNPNSKSMNMKRGGKPPGSVVTQGRKPRVLETLFSPSATTTIQEAPNPMAGANCNSRGSHSHSYSNMTSTSATTTTTKSFHNKASASTPCKSNVTGSGNGNGGSSKKSLSHNHNNNNSSRKRKSTTPTKLTIQESERKRRKGPFGTTTTTTTTYHNHSKTSSSSSGHHHNINANNSNPPGSLKPASTAKPATATTTAPPTTTTTPTSEKGTSNPVTPLVLPSSGNDDVQVGVQGSTRHTNTVVISDNANATMTHVTTTTAVATITSVPPVVPVPPQPPTKSPSNQKSITSFFSPGGTKNGAHNTTRKRRANTYCGSASTSSASLSAGVTTTTTSSSNVHGGGVPSTFTSVTNSSATQGGQGRQPRRIQPHTIQNGIVTGGGVEDDPSTTMGVKSASTVVVPAASSDAQSQAQAQAHTLLMHNHTRALKEIEDLKATIVSLEESVHEKTSQLKAVSNNQTIIHSQLKTTLHQREKEVKTLQDDMKHHRRKSSSVIESLVRKESAREQAKLRQKLATDGARLGKWVNNRIGIGIRGVEAAWEEGYALKSCRSRRDALKAKMDMLQKKLKEGRNNNGDHGASGGGELDALDREEFEQSISVHLEELRREEKEVQQEEEALVLEKNVHKMALKQVAHEDGSRFNSRPKLHDRYILLSQLGRGGFSEVWRAFDLQELREVAVKIHQLDPRWSEARIENYTKHVAREYEIHREVRHPRIVSLYDVFEIDENSFATVLECCKGSDLDTLMKERKRLPEHHARAILLQILSGMRYLCTPSKDGKRAGIIHYDLKPGNILFDEIGDAKITDFGLSKIMDSPDPSHSMELTSQGAGTYWYLPPECFVTTESVRITNKVDVWSIGVIFYQMLYGRRPFGDGQSQEGVLANNVMLNAREVPFPNNVQISDGAKQFLRECLTYEQALRPNIAKLCESAYVRGNKNE